MNERKAQWVRYFVDYAGLVAFLIVLIVTRSAVTATWGLVAGAAAGLIAGFVLEKRLAPMPMVTFVLALFFGALTLLLHDDRFIKIKPTVVYTGFGVFLLAGLLRGKNPLRALMGEKFQLPDHAIRTLTWRYAVFFLFLAALNEVVWRTQSTVFWGLFKFPGTVILLFGFALSQAPLMMKYAEIAEEKPDDLPPVPPPQ